MKMGGPELHMDATPATIAMVYKSYPVLLEI